MLLLRITNPEITRPLGLFQLKHSLLTPAAENVKAVIIEVIARLPADRVWIGADAA